jgi:hypothetical protein
MRGTGYQITIIAIAFGLTIGLTSANAEDNLRSLIETQIKGEFDVGLQQFREIALANNPAAVANSHDWTLATDFVKSTFYNKAYNYYFCSKINQTDVSSSSEQKEQSYSSCLSERGKGLLIAYKIGTQYNDLLRGRAGLQCELRARLFNAEIEFPPFDFLKQSNGQDALYDYTILNDCFKSIGPQ